MHDSAILKKINLNNKTAIVTGASRGLGRRFSCVLSSMGANVVLAARNKDKLCIKTEIINKKTALFVFTVSIE